MNQKALKPIDFSDKNRLTEIIKDLYCESEITKGRGQKEVNFKDIIISEKVLVHKCISIPTDKGISEK